MTESKDIHHRDEHGGVYCKRVNIMTESKDTKLKLDRRAFIKGVGAVAVAAAVAPHVWIPKSAFAASPVRGAVKHLIYVRLADGFRFTAAFNSAVAAMYNPFGVAENVASGTEWGVGKLLEQASWLEGEGGQVRKELGMKRVTEITNQIAVMPCVDNEPTSTRADGSHDTGLNRFYTGYANGPTSFLTMVNYGLREKYEQARLAGRLELPAFTLDDAGMSIGTGKYASHRPAVMQGDGFDRFGFDSSKSLPAWAQKVALKADERVRRDLHSNSRFLVDAYVQSREATATYSSVFNDDALKISNDSTTLIDNISNKQLADIFGNERVGLNIRLALRLMHFGSPAVFLNQGSYDHHSGEETILPGQIDELNRLISGLEVALKRMTHPSGGSYWDHTLVIFGSEFGRTAGGSKFNSARGSDHGGDFATRWLSMPMMGGLVSEAGLGGRSLGEVRSTDLKPLGEVYGYRPLLKTLMDGLGCDHHEFFPEDRPLETLFT